MLWQIILIIFILVLLEYTIRKFNNHMMFVPYHPTEFEYNSMLRNKNIEHFHVDDVDCVLYNSHGNPSWSDKIILYVHGNGGWIGNVINSNSVKLLSKIGSILIFDYTGYSLDVNHEPSEEASYNDIRTVYNFLLNNKKMNPKNIIIFGHSLGCAISTKLVSELNEENKPKLLILESPFSNISDIAYDVVIGSENIIIKNIVKPILNLFTRFNYNNTENIKKIKNVPILILFSKSDIMINYSHSLEIKKTNDKCILLEIYGNHNTPIYNENVLLEINKLLEHS